MEKKPKQLTFNSITNLIVIAVIGWNGTTTLKLSEHMTRVETILEVRSEEQARILKRMDAIEGMIGIRIKLP